MRTDMIPVSETELFQYCLNSNSLTNCLIKTFLSLYNKKKKKITTWKCTVIRTKVHEI